MDFGITSNVTNATTIFVNNVTSEDNSANVSNRLVIFLIPLGFVQACLNIFITMCVLSWPRLDMNSKILFIHLAASDILSGIITMLRLLLLLKPDILTCVALLQATITSAVLSVGGILLLSLYTLRAVIYANTLMTKMPTKIVKTIICSMWIVALIGTLFIVIFLQPACGDGYFTGTVALIQFSILLLLSMASSVVYISTFLITKKQMRDIRRKITPVTTAENTIKLKRISSKVKIANMTLALLILFLISWVPLICMAFIKHFKLVETRKLVVVFSSFVYLNPLGNIFIYWYRSLEFRTAVRNILHCTSINQTRTFITGLNLLTLKKYKDFVYILLSS